MNDIPEDSGQLTSKWLDAVDTNELVRELWRRTAKQDGSMIFMSCIPETGERDDSEFSMYPLGDNVQILGMLAIAQKEMDKRIM